MRRKSAFTITLFALTICSNAVAQDQQTDHQTDQQIDHQSDRQPNHHGGTSAHTVLKTIGREVKRAAHTTTTPIKNMQATPSWESLRAAYNYDASLGARTNDTGRVFRCLIISLPTKS